MRHAGPLDLGPVHRQFFRIPQPTLFKVDGPQRAIGILSMGLRSQKQDEDQDWAHRPIIIGTLARFSVPRVPRPCRPCFFIASPASRSKPATAPLPESLAPETPLYE